MGLQIVKSVRELIGRTPMLELRPSGLAPRVRLFAKLEYFNPGGSVKDRIGRYLIEAALRDGRLRPGGTVIEPTAGNTGIGLALAAIGLGLQVMVVVPEHFSVEKQALMRALGAQVVNTPREQGMGGAIAEAKRLGERLGGFVPQQFANPDNPRAHYETTGPEIYGQLDGQITAFVAGVGSGGTFTGVARYLKERDPAVRAVVVQPQGSVFNGDPAGPHRVEGIGNDFIPQTFDTSLVDEIETIVDSDSFDAVNLLAREYGLLVGSSSGAAYVGALRTASRLEAGNVVTIFADGSERYLSCSIYG